MNVSFAIIVDHEIIILYNIIVPSWVTRDIEANESTKLAHTWQQLEPNIFFHTEIARTESLDILVKKTWVLLVVLTI